MDKRDLSTPSKDCWHSTYGNFCKCDQALFPVLGGAWGWGWGNVNQFLMNLQKKLSLEDFPVYHLWCMYVISSAYVCMYMSLVILLSPCTCIHKPCTHTCTPYHTHTRHTHITHTHSPSISYHTQGHCRPGKVQDNHNCLLQGSNGECVAMVISHIFTISHFHSIKD